MRRSIRWMGCVGKAGAAPRESAVTRSVAVQRHRLRYSLDCFKSSMISASCFVLVREFLYMTPTQLQIPTTTTSMRISMVTSSLFVILQTV